MAPASAPVSAQLPLLENNFVTNNFSIWSPWSLPVSSDTDGMTIVFQHGLEC